MGRMTAHPSPALPLPAHLRPRPAGIPAEDLTERGERFRIQVLTERLVRVEWSPTGRFEDRPTQMVVTRDLAAGRGPADAEGASPSSARITRTTRADGTEQILVRTPHLTLTYDGEDFTPEGLSAEVLDGDGWGGTWRWGQEDLPGELHQRNLGGTARTLDMCDGRVPLDPGILDGRGITGLADTTAALTPDGWIEGREPGSRDLYVFAAGADYRGALADFYRLTGAQPLIPRFALGNWWSRYYAYTDSEYLALMDEFRLRGIPLSVAVIDMDWHVTEVPAGQGSGWTGYTWNRELFPDPEAFLAALHERGLATTLNLHPADGIRSFEDAYPRVAARLGIDPASGDPVPFDPADPATMLAYLEDVLHPLEEQGVDFWWIDWQQGALTRTPGLDPLWMLNHLQYLDSAHRHDGRGLILSRYAGPGSHRYPVGFSGDAIITWDSLAFQPEFTATAANIGYGWWSHDIGGHIQGVRDGELQTRWVQFGVFSPIMRLHSTDNPFTAKEPWRFGPRECAVQEDFLRLRHRLVPYLASEQQWGHEHLQPLIQPVYWEDPHGAGARRVPDEYLFGRCLLVAPVTQPASAVTDRARVDVWLPEGIWMDLFTGVTYDGGRLLAMHRPLETLPVLARPGTVLPLADPAGVGVGEGGPAGRLRGPLTCAIPDAVEVLVVPGADGAYTLIEDDEHGHVARTTLAWDDAARELTVQAADGDAEAVPARRSWRVRMAGTASAAAVERAGTASPVVVRLPADARAVPAEGAGEVLPEIDTAAVERIRALLDRARAANDLKVALMAAVETGSRSRAVAALVAEDAPDDLRDALVELLTARV